MTSKRVTALTATLACALVAASADASVLTFEDSVEYTGGTPPAGAAPWIVAEFDDHGSAGTVELTITSRLSAGEFLSRILFNLDPALDPTALRFRQDSATGEFLGAQVLTARDDLRAAGSSLFDVKLLFETSNAAGRFDGTDAVTFTITGIPALTAQSFNFGSVGGSLTNLLTAAHVQGISSPGVQVQTVSPGPEGSGWVTVPEPASPLLAALGASALLCRRRTALTKR